MIYKIIGAAIIAVAGVLAFFIIQDDSKSFLKKEKAAAVEACVQLTPAQQLAKLINDDFDNLNQTKQLPPAWNKIATVELRMNSQLAKTILGKERPNIQRVKEGTSYLELEIVDLPDEENPGIIIQASLFDIKSKNKIFEIGRTYTMNDLNKITHATETKAPAAAQPKESAAAPTTTSPNPGESTTPVVSEQPKTQSVPAADPKSQSVTPSQTK